MALAETAGAQASKTSKAKPQRKDVGIRGREKATLKGEGERALSRKDESQSPYSGQGVGARFGFKKRAPH